MDTDIIDLKSYGIELIYFVNKQILTYRKEHKLLFYVVAYDITDNKRRTRLHKLMKQYGANAQRSVFECDIKADSFSRLVPQIKDLIDKRADDVKIYYLCNACLNKARTLGNSELYTAPDLMII